MLKKNQKRCKDLQEYFKVQLLTPHPVTSLFSWIVNVDPLLSFSDHRIILKLPFFNFANVYCKIRVFNE